ncbi:hypothetical protein CHLRE_06g260350v5 [Chlamydomonas reinhardtii]|uniref:J domain-containing protein n=1 Tax=Chlamydomonas reinhardtii TaxID=3055 RepID=A0A2K3DMQ4_CHLRE|nr:uncharacterized protein CHLRE_06g260350v5 [Chlamydomonas reinhardtii]PNW81790.1 hypothetical protein CHLRE_06g260350v5 [Chlamydomonas reinhardtii]
MSGPKNPTSEAPTDAEPQHPLGEPQIGFNDVFSLRKPRDAGAGLASGLKSIAKGILGGAAGLVAAPIVGASQGGVTGFAKGLASGVVGAVVLPVTGVGVGAVQLVRGVINTPEAVMQSSQGKLWDESRREWVEKDAIVSLEPPGTEKDAGGYRRPQSGDDYYAILGVEHNATPDQIKKQYYILARKFHPDKNPNDETAHEKFQKLGEAYQVLGNEELRARYDSHGAAGLDVNFMEGGAFFNMLFGSDQFEHLVGELFIACAARSGGQVASAEMAREQGLRVSKLCVNLKTLLKRYVEGDEEGFVISMRAEADRLVKASFGETMLHTVGKVYDMHADIATGGFFGGMAAKWRSQHENMRSQYQAASAAIKVYAAQQKLEAWQKEQDRKQAVAAASAAKEGAAGEASKDGAAGSAAEPKAEAGGATRAAAPDAAAAKAEGGAGPSAGKGPSIEELMERQRLEEATLPLMLEAMWAANVLDIQNTLKKVCKFVLNEEGVKKEELTARANALKVLGGIFMEAKAPESANQRDAKRQMEEAMIRVVEKRAQAEEDESGSEQAAGAGRS